MASFVNAFQSEWLKKRNTAASWLVLVGGFFIPVIMTFARIYNHESLAAENASPALWGNLYNKNWQFMALFLMPMGVILATSLITQIEYRNNTWKQLMTTPQPYSTLFISKLLVIVVMLIQFFLLFNIGTYLQGMLPGLFFSVSFPQAAFPWKQVIWQNAGYFIDCLPIVGLQYLLGLQFRNFLVSLGAGLGLFIASMIAISWKYGYLLPYTYNSYDFLGKRVLAETSLPIHTVATGYFIFFILLSYILYINRNQKG